SGPEEVASEAAKLPAPNTPRPRSRTPLRPTRSLRLPAAKISRLFHSGSSLSLKRNDTNPTSGIAAANDHAAATGTFDQWRPTRSVARPAGLTRAAGRPASDLSEAFRGWS